MYITTCTSYLQDKKQGISCHVHLKNKHGLARQWFVFLGPRHLFRYFQISLLASGKCVLSYSPNQGNRTNNWFLQLNEVILQLRQVKPLENNGTFTISSGELAGFLVAINSIVQSYSGKADPNLIHPLKVKNSLPGINFPILLSIESWLFNRDPGSL